MPYICYEAKSFNPEHSRIIALANGILEEYRSQGFQLTLRALYYKFIGRDLFPDSWFQEWPRGSGAMVKNCQPNYKRLGRILNLARLAGEIDWDHLVDMTREVDGNNHWDSPAQIIEAVANQYREDRWVGQSNHVLVMFEKDAVESVVSQVSNRLDVPYYSCRGYSGSGALWKLGRDLCERAQRGQELHVVYVGDHDPSGMDMGSDIQRRLSLFAEDYVWLHRVALNFSQVVKLNLPPNPTKKADSRANTYMNEYGDECWELDALEPSYLTDVIEAQVEALMDRPKWEARREREERRRERLVAVHENWERVLEMLEEEGL